MDNTQNKAGNTCEAIQSFALIIDKYEYKCYNKIARSNWVY